MPRLDAAMVQSVDDPILGKIDHPGSNNLCGSPPGAGLKPACSFCRRVRSVGGGQTTATRVSESTGITDLGG